MKNVLIALAIVMMGAGFSACKNKVVRTKSGSELTFVKRNNGAIPQLGQFVYFDYYVKKDSQQLFASNERGQPMKFKLVDPAKFGAQEKPIVEALMMMSKGDSAYITQRLDTLKNKPQGFNGAKVLTIIVVLKDVVNEEKFMADLDPDSRKSYIMQRDVESYMTSLNADTAGYIRRDKIVNDSAYALANDFKAGKLNGKVKTTKSGLKYMVLHQGTGALPQPGQVAVVHYYGTLSDGRKFDDSYMRGTPIAFPLGQGQVIKGWDEGIALLNEGTTAVLFVPSELGYGKQPQPGGPIPPNENLVFYVDVLRALGTPSPPMPPVMSAPVAPSPQAMTDKKMSKTPASK